MSHFKNEPSVQSDALYGKFPMSDYTPFGYIDNPYHSAVINQSGVIRTVPPVGFGYWCRRLPFPYGNSHGLLRTVNYLSFLHPSIFIDGKCFHTAQDYKENGVTLVSRYHTKNMMSYDWEYDGLCISFKYFLAKEDSLTCKAEITNTSKQKRNVTIHLTNIYGYPEKRWWGCDGFTADYNQKYDAGVSKIFAYGDVFALGADRASCSHKVTGSEDIWNQWISQNNLESFEGTSTITPDPIYNILSFNLEIRLGETENLIFSLVRDKNEKWALDSLARTLSKAEEAFRAKLLEDDEFYKGMPILKGSWPVNWKHGWIYDFETIRMTMRPPIGLYKHYWDGMQVHAPRQVLGETAIDCMCLSYADMEMAKEVILGTYEDAIAPHVPCTREDGSVNMISQDGSECATAPIWVLLFPTILSIHERSGDDNWIRKLYPYLKSYIEWWIENRTDNEGWFHVNCSWEAQDGSKRFQVDFDDGVNTCGANVEGVRTVDLEASLAHAMLCMVKFSDIAQKLEDKEQWEKKAQWHINASRSMFDKNQFRDFDARTGKPIVIKDYLDVMMVTPIAVKIASPDQIEKSLWQFEYFEKNPNHWLEWPSFMYIFTEAAWNSGLRVFISKIVADTCNRVFLRIDAKDLRKNTSQVQLPDKYKFRIPGVADEFWPIPDTNSGGCENYGWGATLPTLIIRNIIGFREADCMDNDCFILAPAIPADMVQLDREYGIENLNYRSSKINVNYKMINDKEIAISVHAATKDDKGIEITDNNGCIAAVTSERSKSSLVTFRGLNGQIYKVVLT